MAAKNRSLIALPQSNLEGVLMKLPLPSLLACCLVSKPLLRIIKHDSSFAQMHFAESESQLMIHSPLHSHCHLIDLNADANPAFDEQIEIKPTFNLPLHGFEVTHSCNGLVLLENCNMDDDVHRCVVCNPVTGEYVMLPESQFLSRNVMCAFFYCPITSQFKIFRAFHCVYRVSPESESLLNSDSESESESDRDFDSDSDSDYSESDTMGEVLPWGSDSWESLGHLPFCPRSIYSPCNLNNATHWLCGDENVEDLIVLFNFETGQFGEIPGPDSMDKTHASLPDEVNMVLLDGCLTIFDNYTTETNFDVWKMTEYGVKESWTRVFVIDTAAWSIYGLHLSFKPALCRNNGELVMVCGNSFIIFHDLLNRRGRVVFHPPLELPCKGVAHIPSLVSLRDVIKDTKMVVLNVTPRFAQPVLNTHNFLQLAATFNEQEAAN